MKKFLMIALVVLIGVAFVTTVFAQDKKADKAAVDKAATSDKAAVDKAAKSDKAAVDKK